MSAIRCFIGRCAVNSARIQYAGRRTIFSSTLSVKAENRLDHGTKDTPYQLVDHAGTALSAWHDIPLFASRDPKLFNFVCEIPRGARAKLEISTSTAFNPIKFDLTKDGKQRHYAFDSLVNYGALPQTYEDPEHKDEWTGLKGDGDPLDVCEIGALKAAPGRVYPVKVIGALAMLDGGETDWKLLAVRAEDPLAAKVDDVRNAPDGVLRLMDAIRSWFRTYKVPEGKGENDFAFGGEWQDAQTALAVIESTHVQWQALLDSRSNPIKNNLTPAEILKASAADKPWLPPTTWTRPPVAQ